MARHGAVRHFLRNLSFRRKMILTCLTVSLIPVIILGFFSYFQLRGLLIGRERAALRDTLIQESNMLEYKLDSCTNALEQILWNDGIRKGLSKDYNSNFEMYLFYRDVFDPFLNTIRTLHGDIRSITVYTDTPIYPHGNVLRPLTDLENMPWFTQALARTTPFLSASAEQKSLQLVCQMYVSGSRYSTIVLMELDYGKLLKSLSDLMTRSFGVLLSSGGQTIYAYEDFSGKETRYKITPQELSDRAADGSLTDDYVYETRPLAYFGWNLLLYRPLQAVSASANHITMLVVLLIVFILAAVIFLSSLLSRITVRPLEKLVRNMEQIESGDITITVNSHSSDEIGHLILSFRRMVKQLQYLIEEVLQNKILRQEYEMKALQAQINPHFLYNSLSLINGKAIMTGQPDISRMAQLLSTFYRTSLNRGRHTISVKNELENVRSYINIQFIMHSDSFDVEYAVDDAALACTMVNLLLQPLVENAILHGIDHKESPGRGRLFISCALVQEELVFHVADNGDGMSAEKLASILTEETSGYGVQNVHHRIQLFYGGGYGLSYTSSPEDGTDVLLIIPCSAEHRNETRKTD